MATPVYKETQFAWRTGGALFFLLAGWIGFDSGIALTERPDIVDANFLTKMYYSLSLFVIGGVELGTPYGGPLYGRILVWLAYFGAPILAASTLIEALIRAVSPQAWSMRRLHDHVVIVGNGELTLSTIKMLRRHNRKMPIVVVVDENRFAAGQRAEAGFRGQSCSAAISVTNTLFSNCAWNTRARSFCWRTTACTAMKPRQAFWKSCRASVTEW